MNQERRVYSPFFYLKKCSAQKNRLRNTNASDVLLMMKTMTTLEAGFLCLKTIFRIPPLLLSAETVGVCIYVDVMFILVSRERQ